MQVCIKHVACITKMLIVFFPSLNLSADFFLYLHICTNKKLAELFICKQSLKSYIRPKSPKIGAVTKTVTSSLVTFGLVTRNHHSFPWIVVYLRLKSLNILHRFRLSIRKSQKFLFCFVPYIYHLKVINLW